MSFLKSLAEIGLAPVTSGLSLVGGEDTMARLPLIGGLTGSQTDAQKALLKKQGEMAEEAKKRMAQNEQMRMNALGQQMLAFNPQNQLMAQMFGPDAAFTPQQMAQMVADPGAMSQSEWQRAHEESLRTGKPIEGGARYLADQQRQQQIAGRFTPPGPGPAPLQQVAPQAARRF